VGLIEAIFSGTFSKVTSCPRASITTNGSAVSDSLAAGAGFDSGLAAGAAALVGSGATVATGAGSAIGSGALVGTDAGISEDEATRDTGSSFDFESESEQATKINKDETSDIKIKLNDFNTITVSPY
tara:strand:- start:382 stop:762 length:381 start_codon:yes stop_codon:yes gene_type:complete